MRLALAALLLGSASPALSQSTPKDTASRDSTRAVRDSRRYNCPDCGMLAFGAAVGYIAGFLASPSLYLTHGGAALPKPTKPLDAPPLSVYITGGPVASQNEDLGWSHAEAVELIARGFYADLRYEQYWLLPQHVLYGVARVGYLARPLPGAYGGVVVGYRGARGQPIEGRQQGIEVGFPLFLGLGAGRWRF